MSPRIEPRRAAVAAACLATVVLAMIGCAGDPFDPESVPNARPVARLFVSSQPGDTLNPTSYFQRRFHWSGTDVDGFVREFYVSIETEEGAGADWDTTTATDTTMTFITDVSGLARAVFRLACRDDRGALSDTVTQYVPLRNFPPVIHFVTGYDTVFWSYGSANFRYEAADEDGQVTMDDSVTYYLDTADADAAPVPLGEAGADPSLRPVRMAIPEPATGAFEVELHGVIPPGQRTLNVLVGDEANAVTNHQWSWEALAPVSPVLLVDDFAGDFDVSSYHAVMDSVFGVGGWSLFDVEQGLPDRRWVVLETLREFPCVVWYTGSSTSQTMADLSPQIVDYVRPADPEQTPGKLLVVSRSLLGTSPSLPPALVQNTLGVVSQPAVPTFTVPVNRRIFRFLDDGVDDNDEDAVVYRTSAPVGQAVGVAAMNGAEKIHRLEEGRYYLNRPSSPFVGIRNPHRDLQPLASTVTLTVQWEYMRRDELTAEFRRLLTDELGVVLP